LQGKVNAISQPAPDSHLAQSMQNMNKRRSSND
jgi:hypothetical protein